MMQRIADASPRFKARMAGVLYLLSVADGSIHRALRFAAG